MDATLEQTFSRIVVPLDGSARAEQILPRVATLAKIAGQFSRTCWGPVKARSGWAGCSRRTV